MSFSSYDSKICQNPEIALLKSWKESSGRDVYASSSLLGTNTKANQGLFVIRQPDETKPCVLLSGLDETLFIGDRTYSLSTRLQGGTIFPRGYEYLEHFYRLPFPTWLFRLDGLAFVKMVIVVSGESSVLIRYQLLSSYGDYVRLQVKPIIAFRRTDELNRECAKQIPKLHAVKGEIKVAAAADHFPNLFMLHNAAVVDREGSWFKEIQYKTRSGPVQSEDLYAPCALTYAFVKEDGVYLSVSTTPRRDFDPFLISIREKNRRRHGRTA